MQHALHVADHYENLAIKNRYSTMLYLHYQAKRRAWKLFCGVDLREEKLARDRAHTKARRLRLVAKQADALIAAE